MSGQRARSAVAADHRSAHPNIAGIPWWGAVLSAVVASLIGFAFDAGSGGARLTGAFSTFYVIGCLIAVLAVAQSSLFTAVIQPPLVLFVTVPTAYFLMRSSEIGGLKDILINCGYPLIERFPLMFFTSAAVLLIGLARWYFARANPPAADAAPAASASAGAGGVAAKVSALLGGLRKQSGDEKQRPRRAADRRRPREGRTATGRTPRSGAPSRRGAPRPRHSRAPETEIIEPVLDERPRRRKPRPDEPSRDEPRRRPRPSSSRDPRRSREQREPREPRESRGTAPRERRARYDRYDPYERDAAPDRDDRYERPRPQRERPQRERPKRPSRYDDDYQPFDPYGSDGSSSHHPVSRVRYRGEASGERAEYQSRRREPRDADRWEYDI